MQTASPIRRLFVAAGLLIAVLVACGREITGPVPAPVSIFHRTGTLLFSPHVETAVPAALRPAALQQVAFERVRITLRREDGSIALDTVVTFPAGANELTLTLQVPLPANAPASGVPLNLNLGYVNAAGDTVFKGGPTPVTVVPVTTGGNPPAPVQVPVQYSGPGANATSVVIAPKTASGQPGQGVTFTAQALSAAGPAIPNTPVVFSSTNTAVVSVNATTGAAAFEGRGTARVYAQLLTGPLDSATVTVTLPAARLELASGGDQTALAGTRLAQPVVARVVASDGVGVGGVTVTFAAGQGGTVTPVTAVSAADGAVSAQWTLGPAAGAQTLTATAAGLPGAPLTVNATARVVTPTKLVVTTQPTTGTAGTALTAVSVAAQDADGNVVATFTGDVTVTLGANPGGATLGGTTTVKAVAGVATFSALTLNRPGTGYTLVFSSAPLTAATTNAFTITAGAANQLVFISVPTMTNAGAVLTPAPTIAVRDAVGNTVASFTGAVTIALAPGAPAGSVLSGTLTRNAVAGVSTFPDISVNRTGSVTLAATSTGLRSATSSALTVVPGPAAEILITAGDGQKAVRGSILEPIAVKLTDALGNGVPDTKLNVALESAPVAALTDVADSAVVSGVTPRQQVASPGAVSASTIVTDATGSASFQWTLGDYVGTQRVVVSLAAPALKAWVTASAIAGSASNLAVATGPASTQTAGLAVTPTVVVQARDSVGALQAAFTGTVTASIATGPAGATITGTTTATAVSGAASFSNLRLRKAGTYTLTFSASGLSPATTASFFVATAPATTIAADSGNAQSGAASTVLPSTFVVLVTDSLGNPVSGQSVTWAVTAGGGSLDSSVTMTDTFGRAHARLTLGPTAGANTVTASATGLTGSPVTFTATATAAAATQVVLTREPIASSTSGASDTVIVHVKDAGGAIVTGSTATVTLAIATGPVGSTIIGPTMVAAINGVATFSGVGFDKMGTYTLAAASGGLASDTSASFSITPGWAEFVAADSGNAQSANALTALPNALVARITDQYGNRVPGRSVTWAVATGGGSLSGTTTVSDSGGRVRAQWTLGATAGSQTVTVTASDTGMTTNVATFTATANAVAYSKLWDGSSSTSWADSANWSPSGAPSATDSVKIGTGPNYPTLSGSTTVARLQMDPSTSLALGANTLTVNGSINVPATGFAGSAGSKLVLGGATGSTMVGVFTVDSVRLSGGDYALTGGISVSGSVAITSGVLAVNNGVTISGGLEVSGTGAINQSAAVLSVGGNASFTGTGTSSMTAGDLAVAGNFTAGSGTVVSMVPPHQVRFNGGSAQVITLAPTSAATFGNVEMSGAGAKSLATGSQMAVTGTGFVLAGSGMFTGAARTILRGPGIIDSTAGSWNVDTIYVAVGNVTMLPPSLPAKHFQMSSGSVTLPADFSLPNATVAVYAGPLNLNGHTLTVGKDFTTASTGVLVMQAAGSQLDVAGNATFGGGSTTGTLTAGLVKIQGNLTATGAAFDATGTHTTWMASDTARVLAADPQNTTVGFQNLVFGGAGAKNVRFTGSYAVNVKGNLVARAGSGAIGTDSAVSQVWMLAGSAVHDSTATSDAFRFARLMLSGTTALPKQLVVGDLRVQGVQTLFDSLYTTASVGVAGAGSILDLNGHRLRLAGTNKHFLTEIGGMLKMKDAADSLVLDNGNSVTFNGGATDTTLTAGRILLTGDFSQGGDPKAFAAGGAHIVRLMGTGTQQVQFASPGTSGSHFGRLLIANEDTVELMSTVYAATLETATEMPVRVRRGIAGYPVAYAKGGELWDFTFDGVSFVLGEGAAVTALNGVSFINQDPTATQFTIARSGTGMTGSITSLQDDWLFSTPPSTGKYLLAQDTDSLTGGNLLTVTFGGTVSPASHGGKAVMVNGASTNWPFGMSISAVMSGNWSDSTTWSPAKVPGPADDVTISGERTVTLTSNAAVHHLTLSTGGLAIDSHDLTVGGNLTTSGESITGYGTVKVVGSGAHTLNVQSMPNLLVDTGAVVTLDADLQVAGTADVNGQLVINGQLLDVDATLTVLGGLKMTNTADTVHAGSADFSGVASDTLLTAGALFVYGNFTQAGSPRSFAPTGAHVTVLATGSSYGGPYLRAANARAGRVRAVTEAGVPFGPRPRNSSGYMVSFANPGWANSRFNVLRVSNDSDNPLYLSTSVYAVRAEVPDSMYTRPIGGSGGTQHLHAQGGWLAHLRFEDVAVHLEDGGTVDNFSTNRFLNFSSASDQLTVNRTGVLNLNSVTFEMPPQGNFLNASTSGALSVNMADPYPGSHGGNVVQGAGVALNGWVASRLLTSVASGNWNSASTWLPAVKPSPYDTVSIGAGQSITVDTGAVAKDVFLTPTSGVMLGYNYLKVFGNWSSDTLTNIAVMSGAIDFFGNASVSGRIANARFHAPATVMGTTVANSIYIDSGAFDVGGNVVIVNGPFTTDTSGFLRMTNAAGNLQVAGDANFYGGSSNSQLTAGLLKLRGSFYQAGDPAAFSATGAHTTVWGSPSTSSRTLQFSNAGGTTSTSHFGILQLADTTQQTAIGSDIWAVTRLSTPATGVSITLFRNGSVYTDTLVAPRIHAANVNSTGYLYLNRVMLDVYNADTTTVLNNATFNMFKNVSGEVQLTIASATPTLTGRTFTAVSFQTMDVDTYRYVHAENLGTNALTLNFTGGYPTSSIALPKTSTAGSPLPTITWTP